MKNLLLTLTVIVAFACNSNMQTKQIDTVDNDTIRSEDFDTVIDGQKIQLYTIKNSQGVSLYLTNYGARVVGLYTKDRSGNFDDIVLGFNNIKDYLKDPIYLGCIVGRYANRIKNARFKLGGEEYNLVKNEGENTLHGGKAGLDKKIWKGQAQGNKVIFSYTSPDGEEGYPGNLSVTKSFSLSDNNELHIEYSAETDKATVINLSNHAYYNLKGEGDTTILDHYFQINADHFTAIDNEWIPTGEIAPVEGTPFDFRTGKPIGQDLGTDNMQLKNGLGYDHNWVLNKENPDSLTMAAKLWEKGTGRYMEIYTTEPGFQFYSGNFMDGSVTGKAGKPYVYRSALVLEAQHFPDSPNHENFPSTVLQPGEKYYQLTVYKFGVLDDM